MKNMNINVRVKLGVNMASKLITAKYFVNNFSFTLQQLVVKYLNPCNIHIIVLVTFRPSRRNLSQLQINVQINNFHFYNFEFSAKEKV